MTDLRLTSPLRYLITLAFGWFSIAMLVGLLAALAVGIPQFPGWAWALAAAAAVAGAAALLMLVRIRRVHADAAGLHVTGGLAREMVQVPWGRVRRMRLTQGRNGSMWRVEYVDEAGAPVRAYAPCWAAEEDRGQPRQVQELRALWSAGAGPVALHTGWGTWTLEASVTR